MLFEPPFTNLHQDGVVGLFEEAAATKVIKLIDQVNENAFVGQQAVN